MKVGSPDAEQLWTAFERFVRAVVPVAEKAGVRLALHPDDPPITHYRGAARIMNSVDAFDARARRWPTPRPTRSASARAT